MMTDPKPFPAASFRALTEPLGVPAPEAAPKSKTKVQLAIDCLAKLGSATADQLRDAMGLDERASISPYLKVAREDGRIERDGERWKLGTPAIAPTPERRQENVGIEGRKELQPEALAAAGKPVARCITWLELERDDGTLLRLSAAEAGAVYECMAERLRA